MSAEQYLLKGASEWKKWKSKQKQLVSLAGSLIRGKKFEQYDFSGCNFDQVDLFGVEFSGCNLDHTSFSRAKIKNSIFAGSSLQLATFNGSVVENSTFNQCKMQGTKFRNTTLDSAKFFESKFKEGNLSSSTIINSDFRKADLRKADFRNSEISNCLFSSSYIEGSIFTGSRFKDVNAKGASASHAKFEQCHFDRTLFEDSILKNSDFSGSTLIACDFRNADMRNICAQSARFESCSLSGCMVLFANFSRSKFAESNFQYSNMCHSNFRMTVLNSVRVFGASLWNCDFNESRQSDIIISNSGNYKIIIGSIEYAFFMHQASENKNIKKFLETSSEKLVLIIGRFTPERKHILENVRLKLSQNGYIPVILDFEKPDSQDLTETVLILALLARFVVVDLSDPSSSPHELATIAPNVSAPIAPIIEDGLRPYAMFSDLQRRYSWVRPLKYYPRGVEIPMKIVDALVLDCEEFLAYRK